MHLLHILPRLPAPPNDGGAVYVYNMLKELNKIGHDLSFVSFISNKHEQDPERMQALGNLYAEDGQFTPYSFFPVLKSVLTRQPVTIQHRMRKDIISKLLSRVSHTPDAILLEGLHTADFMNLVRKRFPGVPVVLRLVNVEYMLLEKNGDLRKNPLFKWFYKDQARLMKSFEIQAIREADYITSISDTDIKLFKKHLPETDIFLNTAGATVKEDAGISRDPAMILAVSNWRWQPNIDGLRWFMDEIWPSIRRNHPDVRFHIAGEGISDEFKKKYNSHNVHFLGFVDDIDALRLKASVFVAPLLSGSGMKLKVLEALACGLPLVTTTYGAQGIDMQHKEHYLHADTASNFSDALSTLIGNADLRTNFSSSGKALIREKYTWKQKARELSDFLHFAIENFQ